MTADPMLAKLDTTVEMYTDQGERVENHRDCLAGWAESTGQDFVDNPMVISFAQSAERLRELSYDARLLRAGDVDPDTESRTVALLARAWRFARLDRRTDRSERCPGKYQP